MSIFKKNAVNTSRQIELDIAKAICLVGMVFVHCFEEINYFKEDVGVTEYVVTTVLDCIFGASTFMFCMGFGIAYSRNSSPEKLIKRGATILLFSYILNIVRGTLPLLVSYAIAGAEGILEEAFMNLLFIDIMQFAGLALMLFGLLKKLKLPALGIGAVAVGMSVTGSFVRTFDTGSIILNQIIGLFLGTLCSEYDAETISYFPLFNWFIFVAAGYLFALLMRRCSNKNKLYAFASPAAGVLVVVYMLIAIPNKLGMMGYDFNKFYHLTSIEAAVCILASVAVLGMYFALSKLLTEKIKSVITDISGNINRIYCIHWVILGWVWFPLYAIYRFQGLPDWIIFCAGTVLFIVSAVAAHIYAGMKEKHRVAKALRTQ